MKHTHTHTHDPWLQYDVVTPPQNSGCDSQANRPCYANTEAHSCVPVNTPYVQKSRPSLMASYGRPRLHRDDRFWHNTKQEEVRAFGQLAVLLAHKI